MIKVELDLKARDGWGDVSCMPLGSALAAWVRWSLLSLCLYYQMYLERQSRSDSSSPLTTFRPGLQGAAESQGDLGSRSADAQL